MNRSERLEVIEYKPYRGECEPVTDITLAKITLLPDHLEIHCFYEFKELGVDDGILENIYKDNFVKCQLLLKKELLELCRSVRIHPQDKRREECPIIEIWSRNGLAFNVLCENREADLIMKALRNWILS